jgi:ABC-type nitrate/sulfonate/bicarbonate transport system ATPase subunit
VLRLRQLETGLVGPIDLSIAAGECVTVVGASGTGKSMLLRAIVDMDPNRGSVSLESRERDDMGADEWRRLVGLVPAESGWWADRVGDHFTDEGAAKPFLVALGLADALDWEVSRLSTGERHRLAICRTLHLQPQALLLDEPTAALDDAATERVETLLGTQLAAGIPILLVTHDRRQASRLGDRTFVMRDGALVSLAEGSP